MCRYRLCKFSAIITPGTVGTGIQFHGSVWSTMECEERRSEDAKCEGVRIRDMERERGHGQVGGRGFIQGRGMGSDVE